MNVRPPKPSQHERNQRRTTIDTLLTRALRGALTIPEAAVLADYVRAEQRAADKTRRSLGDTTRAHANHRAAAEKAILEAEAEAERLRQLRTFAGIHFRAIGQYFSNAGIDLPDHVFRLCQLLDDELTLTLDALAEHHPNSLGAPTTDTDQQTEAAA